MPRTLEGSEARRDDYPEPLEEIKDWFYIDGLGDWKVPATFGFGVYFLGSREEGKEEDTWFRPMSIFPAHFWYEVTSLEGMTDLLSEGLKDFLNDHKFTYVESDIDIWIKEHIKEIIMDGPKDYVIDGLTMRLRYYDT